LGVPFLGAVINRRFFFEFFRVFSGGAQQNSLRGQ